MKKSLGLLLCTLTSSVFAGAMGDVSTSAGPTNYAAISGGYYNSNYQSNYTDYHSSVLYTKQSFNDVNSSGYAQFALGKSSQFGDFKFDQQVVLGKLGGNESFNTLDSKWTFRQNMDFGYDLMPKLSLFQRLEAFGILGAHYARFVYQKTPLNASPLTSAFNIHSDQIGFNLGAGLNYHIDQNFMVGIKYQHLQYAGVQVNGTNPALSYIIIENITPSFNLVGLELRYFWS